MSLTLVICIAYAVIGVGLARSAGGSAYYENDTEGRPFEDPDHEHDWPLVIFAAIVCGALWPLLLLATSALSFPWPRWPRLLQSREERETKDRLRKRELENAAKKLEDIEKELGIHG